MGFESLLDSEPVFLPHMYSGETTQACRPCCSPASMPLGLVGRAFIGCQANLDSSAPPGLKVKLSFPTVVGAFCDLDSASVGPLLHCFIHRLQRWLHKLGPCSLHPPSGPAACSQGQCGMMLTTPGPGFRRSRF